MLSYLSTASRQSARRSFELSFEAGEVLCGELGRGELDMVESMRYRFRLVVRAETRIALPRRFMNAITMDSHSHARIVLGKGSSQVIGRRCSEHNLAIHGVRRLQVRDPDQRELLGRALR